MPPEAGVQSLGFTSQPCLSPVPGFPTWAAGSALQSRPGDWVSTTSWGRPWPAAVSSPGDGDPLGCRREQTAEFTSAGSSAFCLFVFFF